MQTKSRAIIATLVGLVFIHTTNAEDVRQEVATVAANILAANSASVLAFKNAEDASHIASSISTSKELTFTVIFDANKNVFAEYFRPADKHLKAGVISVVQASLRADASNQTPKYSGLLLAVAPILQDKSILGYVAVGVKKQ